MLWGPIHDRPVPPSRLGDWADWCFLPLAGTYAIVSKGKTLQSPNQAQYVGILTWLLAPPDAANQGLQSDPPKENDQAYRQLSANLVDGVSWGHDS
jgi:hypothetical protein